MESPTSETDIKTTVDFDKLIESFSIDENSGTPRNGFAVYLYNKYNNINDASSALDTIFMQHSSGYASNKKALYTKLRQMISKVTKHKKNIRRNGGWKKIENFLLEPLTVPKEKMKAQPSASTVSTTDDALEGAAQEVEPPAAKQLRRDCEQCLSVREECRAKCRALENTLKEKRRVIRNMRKLYSVKYVNKERKRLYERIAKLKNKLKDLKKTVANRQVAKTQKRRKVPKTPKPTNGTQTIQLFNLSCEVQTIQLSKSTDNVQTLNLSLPAGAMIPLSKTTSQMQPITLSKSTNENHAIQLHQPYVPPLKETL